MQLLTILAYSGIVTILIAITALSIPFPNALINAIAKSNDGKASIISIILINNISIFPP
ncbi:hypothetical protein SDC9_206190 [bioreactor metagenome]|uniref:Uncharacterized protein n=1 Tax=bioreactor metagenome TaxID=1076179 RepID=A0A645J451_9ZZZZ